MDVDVMAFLLGWPPVRPGGTVVGLPLLVDPKMPRDEVRFIDPLTDRCIGKIVNVGP